MRIIEHAHAPIDMIEAAYDLDADDQAWLRRLAELAAHTLDDGNGVVAHLADTAIMGLRAWVDTQDRPDFAWRLQQVTEGAGPEVRAAFQAQRSLFASGTERFAHLPEAWHRYDAAMGALGIRDSVGFFTHTGTGTSIAVWNPSARVVRVTPRARRVWERVATHVGAACRLRIALRAAGRSRVGDGEAVLDSSGRVHHASDVAGTGVARTALRDAVLAMERARGPLRHADGERALDLWRGLVHGRWTLVDRFESDGRRYLVALENAPQQRHPSALRPRESAALELARMGAAPKDIAYSLGVSPSNARALLATAMQKLGIERRGDLYRWQPENGHVLSLGVADSRLQVLSIRETDATPILERLTSAERDVVQRIAAGARNADIALARGTSARTVANQVASILRKLGVQCRADIVAASRGRSHHRAQ